MQGGKRNKTQNQENDYDLKETSKTSESVPKLEENNTSDESSIKDVKPALNSELNIDEGNFSVSRNNENISGFGEPSVSLGVGIANQKNSEDPFDDFDLTIGDFWGIGRDEPFKDPGCKVSVIAVNTEKGEKLLKMCDDIEISKRQYTEAEIGRAHV